MSVANKNMFALLNDDTEDGSVSTPAAKAAPPKPAVAPVPKKRDTERQTNSSRGGRYYKRGGAPTAPAADAEGFTPQANDGRRFDRTEGRPDRGRGRGRGRGGDGPRRGRVFDKESQTGKVDTEKAVNAGWGAETGDAELKAEVQGAQDAQKDAAADGWGATPAVDADAWGATPAVDADAWGATDPAAAPAAATGEDAEKEGARKRREEEEEEDNTITLEEYLAKQKETSALPKLEGRAIETSEFKDAVQLTREESEEVYFAGKAKAAPKAKAKKEEKIFIAIDAPPPQRDGGRGRGGRGGRGGDRGGRGRGGDRGGDRGGRGRGGDRNGPRRAAQNNVDVDDVSAFPSLS